MDKCIIKKSSTSVDNIDSSITLPPSSQSSVSINKIKCNGQKTVKHHKYNDNYLNFNFYVYWRLKKSKISSTVRDVT